MDSGPMEDVQVPKGSLIFRQGDAGDQMFLIGDGRVRLFLESDGHQKEVGVLGPGDFFGELALLRDAPRSATAEAVEDTTLLPISRDVFAMLVQDDLDTVFRMMRNLGERLARTNVPIQTLLMRLRRIRIGLCALKRLLPADAPSVMIDVVALAQEAGMGLRAATEAVEVWVEAGAGVYDEGRWQIDSAQQRDQARRRALRACGSVSLRVQDGAGHRRREAQQALWSDPGGQGRRSRGSAGRGVRAPRAQRIGQDYADPDALRSTTAHLRTRHGGWVRHHA